MVWPPLPFEPAAIAEATGSAATPQTVARTQMNFLMSLPFGRLHYSRCPPQIGAEPPPTSFYDRLTTHSQHRRMTLEIRPLDFHLRTGDSVAMPRNAQAIARAQAETQPLTQERSRQRLSVCTATINEIGIIDAPSGDRSRLLPADRLRSERPAARERFSRSAFSRVGDGCLDATFLAACNP
jgi:hypothetical protein